MSPLLLVAIVTFFIGIPLICKNKLRHIHIERQVNIEYSRQL